MDTTEKSQSLQNFSDAAYELGEALLKFATSFNEVIVEQANDHPTLFQIEKEK